MEKVESGKLLEDCRELMTNRMRTSMSRMMGYVEDLLFEMATEDSGTIQANHYIEAIREIRMKKREIQVRFENRFITLFQDGVRQLNSGQISHDEHASILIEQELTNSAPIKNTLNKARSECRSALLILDGHVSSLFDSEHIEEFVNPMQPDTVFSAFWESCRDIHAGADIRNILVDMFERYVVTDLHNVYEDMNLLFGFYHTRDSINMDIKDGVDVNNKDETLVDSNREDGINQNSLLVRMWVESRIGQQISQHGAPDFIRQFLLESWQPVLVGIYEVHGDKSLEWDRAMQVVDDLLICTKITNERESRTQQIWMLPGLIYRLKNGMKNISLPLKMQAEFLSELKAYYNRITELNPEIIEI
jgi:hypothetical protein